MRHQLSGETRAIKVIQKPSCEEHMQMISNEVCALLQLDHPNIARMFEYFEAREAIYLVTELCTGGNLGELDPQVDDPNEIRLLFRDVLRAIAYCHSEGIAHRDLKFENCLLTACDERPLRRMAKVIDFGLACFKQAEVADGWMHEVVGTLFFSAPEVLRSHDPLHGYGLECDLWSLGVMIFIVLTNEHPYCSSACSADDAYARISKGTLRSSYLLQAGELAIEAMGLIQNLLIKDPLNRCTAAEALMHPWLQPEKAKAIAPGEISPKSETLKILIEQILSFSRFPRFEKAVLTVAAHEAPRKDVEELTSFFSALDPTQAGWISRSDFQHILDASSVCLSKMELEEVLDALDPDADGKIQETDFLAATLKPSYVKSQKACKELFNWFDFKGTGRITHEDLVQVLGQDMACHVALQANANAEGFISKEGFRAFILKAIDKLELHMDHDRIVGGNDGLQMKMP